MKTMMTREEYDNLAKDLGFKTIMECNYFLIGDYGFFSGTGIESDEEYVNTNNGYQLLQDIVYVIQKKGLINIYDAKNTTEDQVLLIINIIKQINVAMLLKKFDGKIDKETAERLIEYTYTHGNCRSLEYTLCQLFDKCEPYQFDSKEGGGYSHHCVKFNGKYYDITGVKTELEMKEFVAHEGKNNIDQAVLNLTELDSSTIKLLEYILIEAIKKEYNKNKDDRFGGE